MATNQYVNNYSETNEQDLVQDLVDESIQMSGMDVLFIPRNQPNINYLYNEDPTNTFGDQVDQDIFNKHEIEVYQENVDDFEGGDYMSEYGYELASSATFVMSKRRFSEVVAGLQDRPEEGDLVWSPITQSLLEIKHVDASSPFFQFGKNYVYRITVSLFRYSYENIDTGDASVDSIIDSEIGDILDPSTEVEEYGQNDALESEGPDIEFDPSNPFSVR